MIAWFLCPMLIGTSDGGKEVFRYCGMNDFNAQIYGDAGAWAETEVLGDVALVKVRASDATLTTIAAAPGFLRVLAKINLTDTLGDLTTAQRTAILNKLQAMGYTLTEISNALGGTLTNWRTHTFGDLLRFVAKRRLKPLRIEAGATVFSAVEDTPLSVDIVHAEVTP